MLQPIAKRVELAEAHDQRLPLVWIDTIGIARHANFGMDVNTDDLHLERRDLCADSRIADAERVLDIELCLHLNWTLCDARR